MRPGRCLVLASLLCAGCASATERWQPLSGDIELDTETFTSRKSDDKGKESIVEGWIRFPMLPAYRMVLLQVEGHCERRTLHYSQSIGVKGDGSQETSRNGGTLTVSPGSGNEAALLAMCKRVKPWWKPF